VRFDSLQAVVLPGFVVRVPVLICREEQEANFEVSLPHTRSATTLGAARQGQAANLEVDILARYLERLLDNRVNR
jgi:riboflavin synthase